MTTSEPGRSDPAAVTAATTAAGLPGSDLPGVAASTLISDEMLSMLARMANRFFMTPPGDRGEMSFPTDAESGAPAHVRGPTAAAVASAAGLLMKTTPFAVPLPGEAELRQLMASRLASGSAVPSGMPGAAMRPGMPTTSPGGMPYFIQDAAIVRDASGAAQTGATEPSIPTTPAGFIAMPPPAGAPLPIPLPGEADLRDLLAPVLARPAAGTAIAPDRTGQTFYFLDDVGASSSGVPSLDPTAPTSGRAETGEHPAFDVDAVRRDFPILEERVNGRPLIWLDNGATTQKPQVVIDRLVHYYRHENSNIHRAAHTLAARATDAYEEAREKVRRFMNASSVDEIVFVRGATEAINLAAQSWGRQNLEPDDEILITWLEHHANIVPWQMVAQQTGARLKVVPVDDRGQVRLDLYEQLLGPRTRMVAFSHVSNALGTVTPAARMIEMAKRYGARTLVDGAQAVSHMRTDVQALDCDFYAFSGHKVFAPTGIGVLYGKREVLEGMPPWQGGGNMIKDVTFENTEYQESPLRFEAGTGSIADAVGLGAAIDYVERIGIENISAYEHSLLAYATRRLATVPGLTMIGTAAEKAAVLSFVLDGFPSEEVGTALNQEGIAVRAGHHCAQPILRRFGLESTVRPSLAFYNTMADIDALVAAVQRIAGRSPSLA